MLSIIYSILVLLVLQSIYSSPISNDTLIASFPINQSSPLIYRDQQFVVGFTKVNWYQANFICNANGYTLATVNSLEQNLQLHNFVAKNVVGNESATEIPQHLVFWLGGTNLAGNDNWSWLSNGLPIYIDNWDDSEPTETSACLLLNWNFKWQSRKCGELNGFICESVCPSNNFSINIYE